jgi:uncharacterized protein
VTNSTPVLMQWGLLQFQVWPLNYHELDHYSKTDWARKEIAGAAVYREWTGEGDEELHLRGKVFPLKLGGLEELEVMETMRRQGIAALMMRGGQGEGRSLGWYVCERLVRNHTFIDVEGFGKQISFEGLFARVPIPSAYDEFPVLWSLLAPN